MTPVPYLQKFEPIGWSSLFEDVGVRHFRDLDIHACTHYLDHPRVHIPILESLINTFDISDEEAKKAITNYKNIKLPDVSDTELKDF